MARGSRFTIGALNIAMHAPHSPSRYVQLFRRIYSLRRIVTARGVTGAIIGNLFPLHRDKPEDGLTGEFYQFIQLDPNEPWFDLESKDEASPDDLQAIVIPERLKPHLARFSFVFFPRGHRLYLRIRNGNRSFGIQTASTVVKRLLEDPKLAEFGSVEVTVEPDKNTIESIFRIPYLKQLRIELVRPNSDDHHDAEKRVLKRLQNQGARKMIVALNSGRGDTLSPDEDTKTLARVAASNGFVVASGRDASDQPVEQSTRDKPWIEPVTYDSNRQTAEDALHEAARQMHAQLT